MPSYIYIYIYWSFNSSSFFSFVHTTAHLSTSVYPVPAPVQLVSAGLCHKSSGKQLRLTIADGRNLLCALLPDFRRRLSLSSGRGFVIWATCSQSIEDLSQRIERTLDEFSVGWSSRRSRGFYALVVEFPADLMWTARIGSSDFWEHHRFQRQYRNRRSSWCPMWNKSKQN